MSISMSDSSTTLGASQDSRSSAPQSSQQSKNAYLRGGPTPAVTPGARSLNSTNDNDSQRTPVSQAEEEEWLMMCRCESGKTLLTLLSCLQHVAESPSDSTNNGTQSQFGPSQFTQRRQRKHKTVQPVTCFCTNAGFTFHVFGPAKQSEASCELQKAMFSHFQVAQDDSCTENWQAGGEFCVNLMSVLDALQLLGPLMDNNTSVGLTYNLRHEILKIELLQDGEGGVLCTSAIPSLIAPADDPDGDSLSNAFRSAPVAARMMVRSGILRELLPEWSSVAGASCASVAVSAKRGLELAVLGHYGECWVQVPAKGDHMVAPLELTNARKTVTRTYPLHSLLSSMKGLEIAEETCININTEGMMAIQHKTHETTGRDSSNFVDFIMTCLEDDEDEDKENEEDDDETTMADASTQGESTQGPSTKAASTRHSKSNSQASASHESPETATTTRRRRRRRRQRQERSISRDSTTVHSNATGEDVEEQDSSNTEGEEQGGTPSERQKRQALQNQKQQEESSSDEEEEEETQLAVSAKPLFGSVVAATGDKNNTSTHSNKLSQGSGTPPLRRQRRSASRPPRRSKSQNQRAAKKKKRSNDADDSDDGSKNMLASDEEEESEEEDEELQHHHARSPVGHHNRDDDCSSPEIVYGKQM